MRRTSQGWVLGVAGLALALAAALTGCAGADGSPPTGSTRSASSITSTTVGATTAPHTTAAVEIPPEATKHTEEGAKAFARYFTRQMDEAGHTADSTSLRELSAPDCSGCHVTIDIADTLKRKNQHHKTTTFTLAGAYIRPESTTKSTVVDVLVDDAGSSTVDASGEVVARSSPAKLTFRHSIEWRDGAWIVTESGLVQ